MFWCNKTNLGGHLQFILQFPCVQADRSLLSGLESLGQEKREISCHWWSLIIPIGSHRQHICSSFAARMWWAEAAYPLITLISALFIHLLPDPSYAQKFFVPENLQGKCVFCFVLLYKVLCVHNAIPGHYVSFSMPLYQTMTSARSNCFQTRQGLSFHFIFRFFAQVSVAQHPAKADNEKRCMMSCRQSTQRQNLGTKFPGSYPFPCRFLRCLFLCSVFFQSLCDGKVQVFFFFW